MTKMAAMPVYGENLLEILFRIRSMMILKVSTMHQELKVYKVCINDDHGLTLLTYIKTMSNLLIVLIPGPDVRRAFSGPLVFWFKC